LLISVVIDRQKEIGGILMLKCNRRGNYRYLANLTG